MKRLEFDSSGRLKKIDGTVLEFFDEEEKEFSSDGKLKTSKDISFLQYDDSQSQLSQSSSNNPYWSLYNNGSFLQPLKFSNGKTQEDVVKEVVDSIKKGKKVILIHGACGTGKSAIALNIARILGKTSIVVPVKGLQRQYEEDYTNKKYLLKENGKKMKIAVITGRDNHDSIIEPGVSCADPYLPDTIRFTEKNYEKLKEYYEKNPYMKNKQMPEIKKLKRIAVAPSNPYWSPILPALLDLKTLPDAKKIKYTGLRGKEFIFYHRKSGCSYYDQYLAYKDADVLIFNSAKYKIEVLLDRKPETEVDIIDEADEFLDRFTTQDSINLTRLHSSLSSLHPDEPEASETLREIEDLLSLEEKNKQALGVDEERLFNISETKIGKIITLLTKSKDLMFEIEIDEQNYANKALEVAQDFKDLLKETYISFKKVEKDLYANIVTTNLSKKFHEVIDKNKALVLMSGTLHSPEVLKSIFGLNDITLINAETAFQGVLEIHRTGKEMDCRHANFASGKHTKKEFYNSLSVCLDKAKKPVLIHVNAFEDLPSRQEIDEQGLFNIMSKETLKEIQFNDKTGSAITDFKNKKIPSLFTTKCSRGVDFPGDMCNSIIFTKYPNPNMNDVFWKLLKEKHPDYFWDFYKDKAKREFLQRIYRALRSKDDHVYILSPDLRVIQAVQELQRKG